MKKKFNYKKPMLSSLSDEISQFCNVGTGASLADTPAIQCTVGGDAQLICVAGTGFSSTNPHCANGPADSKLACSTGSGDTNPSCNDGNLAV